MSIIEALKNLDAVRDADQIQTEHLPSIAPTTVTLTSSEGVSRDVLLALRDLGVDRLYEHQAQAIRAATDGNNVVLQAPTASGKSLSFQIPVIQSLTRDPSGHALMLYPTKALAFDQRDQLQRLVGHLPGPSIESWWYDGDVNPSQRMAIRQAPPPVLMTNPEMLNQSFLGHGDLWTAFLRSLKWVVLDEIHEYRGYFGSNLAMLLRRFRHYLHGLGAQPQFFLCSATCANAKEHAEALTGAAFVEVNAASAIRPARDFVFIRPELRSHNYWKIFQLRAVNAGLACLMRGKAVLVFCPSRKFAEQCHRLAIRRIDELGDDSRSGIRRDEVAVYRAGLTTRKRQRVQERLKTGAVRLVFTTNALELGIDVGGLDGVILAGFPDSIMAAWQRIGRAGRSWASEAFVIYLSRNNPVDRFHASNLKAFLAKPFDELVINPSNPDLVERHVPCVLHESGGADRLRAGRGILGPALYEAATSKLKHGALVPRGYSPQQWINLRGGMSGQYVLKAGQTEVGTMSAQQQFREAYDRAIYMHGGTTYRVVEVASGRDGGSIQLREEQPFFHTNPVITTSVTMQRVFEGHRWHSSAADVTYCDVTTMERIHQIVEVDERTDTERDRWTPAANQARFERAHALRITLSADGGDDSGEVATGVVTAQHLLRVGALFTIPIDAHDVFTHADVGTHSIYLVESYPGGIGIARKALEVWRRAFEVGVGIAERCPCSKGCPNCVAPPRSGDLDKHAAIAVVRRLLSGSEGAHTHEFRHGLWEPVRRSGRGGGRRVSRASPA